MKRTAGARAAYTRAEPDSYEPRVVHAGRGNQIIDVDAAADVPLTT